MKRSMNQMPMTALAVASALAAFGGKSALAEGQLGLHSSPAQFGACATSALTNEPVTVDNRVEIGQESPKRTDFIIRTAQYGLISSGIGDVDCQGTESVDTRLKIVAGSFHQTVKYASTKINFNNMTFGEWNQVSATSAGSFSYQRACKVARAEKKSSGRKVRVKLMKHVTAAYSDQGYPTVKQTEDSFVQNLPCPTS